MSQESCRGRLRFEQMETVLITGPTSGIGRATADSLATSGLHIVAAGRSEERTNAVVDAIVAAGGSAETLLLDLSSLDSVRRAATEFERRGRTVDILINNAGISFARGTTVDGFEVNFGVNHLGPFLLTHLLRRSFRPGTRIVTLSSAFHHRTNNLDFAKLTKQSRSLLGLRDYAVSKLANVLFVAEMARRQPDWRTYAVHPGFVNTNIIPTWLYPFVRNSLLTPEDGARTTLFCATSASVAEESGGYYANSAPATPSDLALDDALAGQLWDLSEQWCEVGSVN